MTKDQWTTLCDVIDGKPISPVPVGFIIDSPWLPNWAGGKVTLLGNIPPRDVLAGGTADDVRAAVRKSLDSIDDTTRVILSCGGGMPPGVSTENIRAFTDEAAFVKE